MSTPNAEDICDYCQGDGGIHNAIGEFMTCHECKETPNAEDLVIEFENQSGRKYSIFYNPQKGDRWTIMSDIEGFIHTHFTLLKDAEECAEILKRSV